jgi:DNA-binding GntR family transcriptional regulator
VNPNAAWRRIAAEVRDRITSGQLKPGDRVPSEERLGQEYQVSRTTVRRATIELQHDGLLVVRNPFGTFVADGRRDVRLGPDEWADCDGLVTVVRCDGGIDTLSGTVRISPR